MVRDWVNVSIPGEMAQRIKKIVENAEIEETYGFGNVAEFVRRALSDKIHEIENEVEKKEKKV